MIFTKISSYTSRNYSTMPSNSITTSQWLESAISQLTSAGIENPRLDCLVILEDALGKNRSHILANPNELITNKRLEVLDVNLAKRRSRIPLAYIRGTKEFYGLNFQVNPDVLIPRPETEDIIEIFESLPIDQNAKVADIGTGSGNIAITLAKRNPNLTVFAYDIDQYALNIARVNAKQHEAQVNFGLSDLLGEIAGPFNTIIANLPYVDTAIETEPEIESEPQTAIFSGDKGLKHISDLINQINDSTLVKNGWLILESHEQQHDSIKHLCSKQNLILVQTKNLIQAFKRKA